MAENRLLVHIQSDSDFWKPILLGQRPFLEKKRDLIMPIVFCAVKAIIRKGDKFLILRQKVGEKIFWDLPGGRVNFGESPYETLKREVKEEACMEISSMEPVGMWWFFRVSDGNQVVCNTFLCEANGKKVDLTKNVAGETIDDFRWVTREEFLKGDFSVSHESLKELVRDLEI